MKLNQSNTKIELENRATMIKSSWYLSDTLQSPTLMFNELVLFYPFLLGRKVVTSSAHSSKCVVTVVLLCSLHKMLIEINQKDILCCVVCFVDISYWWISSLFSQGTFFFFFVCLSHFNFNI